MNAQKPLKGMVTFAQSVGYHYEQQDRVVHVPFNSSMRSGHLIGVFDGTGGRGCYALPDFCVRFIGEKFNPNAVDLEAELFRLVDKLDNETYRERWGTTCSLAVIDETAREVVSAGLGDSPIVIVDANGATIIGEMHNANNNVAEREACIRRGGVFNGRYMYNAPDNDYGLSSTFGIEKCRSLGEYEMHRILSKTPAIQRIPISEKSVVMVCSDGIVERRVYDLDPDRLNAYLALAREGTAEDIVRERERTIVADNISVICWRPVL